MVLIQYNFIKHNNRLHNSAYMYKFKFKYRQPPPFLKSVKIVNMFYFINHYHSLAAHLPTHGKQMLSMFAGGFL